MSFSPSYPFKLIQGFKDSTKPSRSYFKPIKIVSNLKVSDSLSPSEYYLMAFLENFKTTFGFSHICWWELHAQGMDVLSTYPEHWLNLYFQNQYEENDMVIQKTKSHLKPFFWDFRDEKLLTLDQRHIMIQAALYGLNSGITFPIQFSQDKITALSFTSSQSTSSLKKFIRGKENDWLLLGHIFCMLLKAHQAGADSLHQTQELLSFYTDNLYKKCILDT